MRKEYLMFLVFFLVLSVLLFFTNGKVEGISSVKLTDADCIKCHVKETSKIETSGGKHKTIGCLGCHKGHYPKFPKKRMIPKCSECHKGKEHYTCAVINKGCEKCHDPHSPIVKELRGELKKECVSCHKGPWKDLKRYVSKHTYLPCNACHLKHGYIPSCLKCHKGHLAMQTFNDCKKCHEAHKPLKITYSMNIPNKYCTACHKKEGKMLKSTETKHRKLACVFCHFGRHKSIPSCQACHGEPHPRVMVKGKKCLDCHNDAHALIK